jgi:hypothetical protein
VFAFAVGVGECTLHVCRRTYRIPCHIENDVAGLKAPLGGNSIRIDLGDDDASRGGFWRSAQRARA